MLNALNRYFSRVSTCIDAIRSSYYEQGDLHGLCQVLSDFVDNPVLAYDDAFLPIAQMEFPREFAVGLFGSERMNEDYLFRTIPDWSGNFDSETFDSTGAVLTEDPRNSVITAVCNIHIDGEFKGLLEIFQLHKKISAGDMIILEEAVKIVEAAKSYDDSGPVVRQLMGHPVQPRLMDSWLKSMSWDAGDGVYVLAFDLPDAYGENRMNMEFAMRIMRRLVPHSVSAQMDDMPIIVGNNRLAPRDAVLGDMPPFLKSPRPEVRIGASEVLPGIGRLNEGYVHARFAARFAAEAPGDMRIARFEDCRFAFFVDLCGLSENCALVLDATVSRLFDDDVAGGSDNTLTVKTYIETGFNLNATARALSVHRNTVAYRLKHVNERYGLNLSAPIEDANLLFQVLLSCKLLLGDM